MFGEVTWRTVGITLSFTGFIVFSILGLIASVRSDRNLSYARARMKSVRNSLLWIFGGWLLLMVGGMLVKPDTAETVVVCIPGFAIILFINFAIAYLQIVVMARGPRRGKRNEQEKQ